MKRILLFFSILVMPLLVQGVTSNSNSKSSVHNSVQKTEDKKSIRKSWKKLKKEFKKMRKSLKGGGNPYLIIPLGILVFLAYTLLIFVLEYSLGFTPLFTLLLLAGWTAIIIGMVRMIKKK